jgi:hypothetical protein
MVGLKEMGNAGFNEARDESKAMIPVFVHTEPNRSHIFMLFSSSDLKIILAHVVELRKCNV